MLNATKKSELRSGAVARERRVHPRYSFSATMEAVHLQADTRLAGRISDLSHGGCYVDTINPFPVGADVKLRIANGNESLVAQARVAYAADGMGMGLEFTHMDQERAKTLERWLADTSGASRAAQALEDAPDRKSV